MIAPNKQLIPEQFDDDRVGYVNFWADGDGCIRRFRYTATDSQLIHLSEGREPAPPGPFEVRFESFDARALRKLGHAELIPHEGNGRMIRFGPDNAYLPRPYFEVFVPALWERNYGSGTFFKDKIVMVGSAAAIDSRRVSDDPRRRDTGTIAAFVCAFRRAGR